MTYKYSIKNAEAQFPDEEWRTHTEYGGIFCVSKSSKIYSCRTGRLLKTRIESTGYYAFGTRIGGRKGTARFYKVHRLVAFCFIDNPCPETKTHVNHKDGCKLNNVSNNLEWVTPQENTDHAIASGLIPESPRGEDGYWSKLTEDLLTSIRERYVPRCKVNGMRAIARELGVHHSTISEALSGVTWSHLKQKVT